VDKVPMSDLCNQHGLSPKVFYRWQKQFFENGSIAFTPKRKGKESSQNLVVAGYRLAEGHRL